MGNKVLGFSLITDEILVETEDAYELGSTDGVIVGMTVGEYIVGLVVGEFEGKSEENTLGMNVVGLTVTGYFVGEPVGTLVGECVMG